MVLSDTATGKGLPIGTDGDTMNEVFMPCEGVQEVSGLQVPQLDGLIITATGKGLPIGTDGDTLNDVFMPCEGVQEVSGLQVPQLDGLIITATGKGLSIGTDGDTQNEFSYPVRVRRRSPVFRFHNLMVISSLPLARVCPSGLMATL